MKADAEEERLLAYRALRDEAWALVRDDIGALREDLEQRGLGARLADRVGEGAHDVWEQTLDVAAAHRGVVATTVIALIAWLLRRPIVHGLGAMLGGGGEGKAGAPADAADDTPAATSTTAQPAPQPAESWPGAAYQGEAT